MHRSNGLLGVLGVILLAFAGIALALTHGETPFDVIYIAIHAVGGVLAILAYLSD